MCDNINVFTENSWWAFPYDEDFGQTYCKVERFQGKLVLFPAYELGRVRKDKIGHEMSVDIETSAGELYDQNILPWWINKLKLCSQI
jgi:hypothetical protein